MDTDEENDRVFEYIDRIFNVDETLELSYEEGIWLIKEENEIKAKLRISGDPARIEFYSRTLLGDYHEVECNVKYQQLFVVPSNAATASAVGITGVSISLGHR